jgi:group II intron reverse transcriptase/maturase
LEQGYTWIVDADIRTFFDSLDHERLLDRINEKISDGTVLSLVRSMLEAGAMVEGALEETEQGTPQGGVISPLLANIYLHPLDEALWPQITRYRYVRYADDFVVCCRSRKDAEAALAQVRQVIAGLGLMLHPEKTRIVTHEEGFDFLGYHFQREPWQKPGQPPTIRPRDKALVKFKDRVREITRRQQGKSVEEIVGRLNRYLRNWRSYYRYTTWPQQTFRKLDDWIRHRIRSYLAKRWNRIVNTLYPTRHLAKLGLYTLESGQPLAGLPRQRRNPSSKAGYRKSVCPV